MKELLAGILGLIAVVIIIYVIIAAGYLFGMLLAITPFIGGFLTASLPITTAQLPAITAWLTVVALFLGVFIGGGRRGGAE